MTPAFVYVRVRCGRIFVLHLAGVIAGSFVVVLLGCAPTPDTALREPSAFQRTESAISLDADVHEVLCVSGETDRVVIPFTIVNTDSLHEMHLRTISQSCSCLDVSIADSDVLPRTNTSVEVAVLPRPGDLDINVVLSTGLEQPQLVMLHGRIVGLPAFAIFPTELPLLEVNASEGAAWTFDVIQTLAMNSNGPAAPEPVELECAPAVIKSSIRSMKVLEHRLHRQFITRCEASLPPHGGAASSIQHGSVEVRAGKSRAALAVTWKHVGRLRSSPDSLYVNRVIGKADNVSTKYVILYSRHAFSIERLNVGDAKIDITVGPMLSSSSAPNSIFRRQLSVAVRNQALSSDAQRHELQVDAVCDDGARERLVVPILITSLH